MFSASDLDAYLDEQLPPAEMARIEEALRDDEQLVQQLAEANSRRTAGLHSLGEIWRRHRISCPPRQTLGGYLLGTLEEDQQEHLRFHIEVTGCRYCLANLEDLRTQQQEPEEQRVNRRKQFIETSSAYLK